VTGAKVVFEPVTFTKAVDSTSPAFALAAASGQPFPQVMVEFVKTGQTPIVFARVELTGVRVVQYKASGTTPGSPTEAIALSFAKIKWTMPRINPPGAPPKPSGMAGWDLVNNKAF
jgi:type VI secretion system Hcp family effector